MESALNRRKEKRVSKTMTYLPPISVKYVEDESLNSERRCDEIVEILYKMLVHRPKRGRPKKFDSEESLDAA